MAKKKKTAQKNKVVQIQKKVQKKSAVVRSDANIEGTEEAKKLLAEVPNPFKANFLYCICGIVAGALVALIPLFGLIGAAIATALGSVAWNVSGLTFVRRRLHVNPTILPLPGKR